MKKPFQSLSFVIPAYNNEQTIERAIREAVRVGGRVAVRFEIIVLDDASRDGTFFIVKRLKRQIHLLRTVVHKKNLGYGGTIKELYQAARTRWIFSVPGDYQVGAQELLKLLPYAGEADMIIGRRVIRRDPWMRRFQSKVYNKLIRMLFGLPVHDVNSVRLMKTAILRDISLTASSAFVDAQLTVRAWQKGYRIREVPIDHRPDVGPGGGGNLGTIIPTARDLVAFWLASL